jgi:hypothetical protein
MTIEAYDVYLHRGDNRAEFLATFEGSKGAVLHELEVDGWDTTDDEHDGRHYGEVRLDPAVE